MDDALRQTSLPDDIHQLKAMIAARDEQLAHQQTTITTLTKERDTFYLEKLRLEVRLAKALKQAYGPKADRVGDTAQMLLDFGQKLEAMPVKPGDMPPEEDNTSADPQKPVSRRIRTRGRRDIGSLDNLPMVEQKYELAGDLCRCPACQAERKKIGEEISYTVEHIPASLLRIKHIQCKYACPHCEQNGEHPQIELAGKTNGSPIDKGMPGPGLLAYIATSTYADYLPLNR
jgi:transposase